MSRNNRRQKEEINKNMSMTDIPVAPINIEEISKPAKFD